MGRNQGCQAGRSSQKTTKQAYLHHQLELGHVVATVTIKGTECWACWLSPLVWILDIVTTISETSGMNSLLSLLSLNHSFHIQFWLRVYYQRYY